MLQIQSGMKPQPGHPLHREQSCLNEPARMIEGMNEKSEADTSASLSEIP